MVLSPPIRPEVSITRLIVALEPIGVQMEVMPRKRLLWEYKDKPQIYIFKNGIISLLRTEDSLLYTTVYDSHIFGVAEHIQEFHRHVLRAESESTLLRVDADKALAIFDAQNLWQDVAVMLAYLTSYSAYRNAMVVQQRTYSVIRNHLVELIQLPLNTRLRTSILEYIQERTHLSRSSILNVVFSLRNGNYIHVKRGGYLLEVTSLPEKF